MGIAFILLPLLSCNNQLPADNKPIIITVHDTVYKFVPHVAPEKAYLGKYESVRGPFMIPKAPGSKDSILIEDHDWRIDSGYSKYVSTARGYLHRKGRHGRVEDLPIVIHDSQDYDSLRTRQPATRPVPIAAVQPASDSVHLPSKDAEQEVKALWKKLRKVSLPYTYSPGDGTIRLTITSRTVSVEQAGDTLYLITNLTCLSRSRDNLLATPAPMTMQAREPIE